MRLDFRMDLFFVTSVRRRRRRARLGDACDRPFRIFFYDGPFRFVDGTTSRSKKIGCRNLRGSGDGEWGISFFCRCGRVFSLVRIILRWSVAAARRHRVMFAFVE